MDAETFHSSFANPLGGQEATAAFERTATYDSRNVLRACMGENGRIDFDRPHAPLLFIVAEQDQITPMALNEKNARAYAEDAGLVACKAFKNHSHYICGEPGWEGGRLYRDVASAGRRPGVSGIRPYRHRCEKVCVRRLRLPLAEHSRARPAWASGSLLILRRQDLEIEPASAGPALGRSIVLR